MAKTMEMVFNLSAVSSKFVGGFNTASNAMRNFNVDILTTQKRIKELEKSQKSLNQMNDRAKASNIYKRQQIEIDNLNNSLKGLVVQKSRLEQMNIFKQEMKTSSKNMLKAAAWGIPAVLAARSAIHMESGMADVQKTVKFHNPEEIKKMEQDIIKLSTQMPMSTEEISKIVAFGGQAGVANAELMDFTRNAAKMGVAFNVSAEQAGETMEQWRTAFKMTVPESEILANKISYLGHNSTANAAKISEVVRRIAALGNVAGVASGDIAALGAAIVGAGITEDVAATGIKHLLTAMSMGSKNAPKTQKAFAALGFDPDQLAKEMQKNGKEAIKKVMAALQRAPKETSIGFLKEMFGMEAIGSLAPLLTNLDVLQKNLDAVNDSTQYGGSLNKLYGIQSATTAAQMVIMKNEVEALSIKMGEILLPTVKSGIEHIIGFAEGFNKFYVAHPNIVNGIAAITAGIWALNLAMAANPLLRLVLIGGAIVGGAAWAADKERGLLEKSGGTQQSSMPGWGGAGAYTRNNSSKVAAIGPKHEVQQFARGGIVTSPILTTFAEEGPEVAIPLSGHKSRAIGLWEKAGSMLGVGDSSSVVFAPTINITGNTDRSMVEQAVSGAFNKFKDMMANYQSEEDRASYV